jgi:cytochrome c1
VPGGDPGRGEVAIRSYGCGACHVIPGIRGARGMVGPPLTGFAQRIYIAGEVTNTPEHLVTWIQVPQSIEPGTAMPNLGVTEQQARDIAAYLYTLR